jgi:hypothetical protein
LIKKKLGLISLAMVLALGTLGVGYAHWSDTVYINQTVETGTVKIGIIKAGVTLEQEKDVATVQPLEFLEPVAPWPYDTPVGAEDFAYNKVAVILDNAYPSLWADIAIYVGCVGSVPVHLTGLNIYDPSGELTFEWVDPPPHAANPSGFFYVTGDPDKVEIINVVIGNLIHEPPTQLHEGEWDKADLLFHIKQPAKQNHTYTFEFEITATQYNWPY